MRATLVDVRGGAAALPRGTLADQLVRRLPDAAPLAVNAALVVAGAALLALVTQVRIPLGFTPVPVTGQTFAVLLVACALGPVRGPLSVALYVAAGVAGAPVFTQGGSGATWLVGPTGGYLVGFAVAAAVLGALARAGADRRVPTAVGSMLVGTAVIYVLGVAGLMAATGADLATAVQLGVVPFLLVDALKLALAAVLLPAAWAGVARLERGARADGGSPR